MDSSPEEPKVEDVYSLDEAIASALAELAEMNEKGVSVAAPHIHLLGRKYAPKSLAAVLQVVGQNEWLLGMESVHGRLLLDTVINTTSQFISDSLFLHIRNKSQEQMSQMLAEENAKAMTKGMRRRKYRIEDKD